MQYLNINKINDTTANSIVIIDFNEKTLSCMEKNDYAKTSNFNKNNYFELFLLAFKQATAHEAHSHFIDTSR